MAASKKRGDSSPPPSGEGKSRHVDADLKEIRKLEEKLREARARRKEKRTAKVRAWRRSPKAAQQIEEVKEHISGFLENVKDELERWDCKPHYRVTVNKDRTVDAEMRIPYPTWVVNIDKATDLLNVVEETMDRVPDMQHISVGFTLNQQANEEGVRASVLQYIKYQGELRLNPNYYDTGEGQALSFQVAYEILRNVTNAHGMMPTGMLVRMSWSPDGWLYRMNDYDLRRKMGKGQGKGRAQKKKGIEE